MRYSKLISFVLLLLFFSCGEEESIETPGEIVAVSSLYQFAYANETSLEPLVVRVLNTDSLPMDGVTVHFKVISGNVVVQNNSVITDANGIAFTWATFGENSPTAYITASVDALPNAVRFVFNVSSSIASKIEMVSGDNQENLAGMLIEPFVVKITDDFGNVARKFPVKFKVSKGDGTLSQQVALTNENGIASSVLTLSKTSVVNEVAVQIARDSLMFNAESVIAVSLEEPIVSNGSVILKWAESVNKTFERYLIYRTDADYPNSFIAIKTIEAKSIIEYRDDQVAQGQTYLYKVVVETTKGTQAVSEVKQIRLGDYLTLSGGADDFQVDEIRKRIYVSIPGANEVHIVDIETKTIIDKILVGSEPRGLALSKDNTLLYVALAGSGDVAIINLQTKGITKVDVENQVGDSRVYYVVEGAPNRVFVTGNTGSGAFVYLAMIKTDKGNEVTRVNDEIMRDQSTLQVDYGKFLYVNANSYLYKIDVSKDDARVRLVKSFYPSVPGPYHIVSPDGTKIFLRSGQQLSTTDFATEYTYSGSERIATNSSGSILYSISGLYITGYNIASGQRLSSFLIDFDNVRKFVLSADGKRIYVLSGLGIYFIENKIE
jgi:DNA-binding beta-propeller fold protein YncE